MASRFHSFQKEQIMTSAAQTLERLTERLNQLERHNRRLRRCLVGLLAAAGVLILAAAQNSKPQAIETDRIVLRDAAGKVRGTWTVGDEGPMLQFLDADGGSMGTLTATPRGFAMRYFDRTKRLQSGVGLQPEGVAVVHYERDGTVQTGRNALLLSTGMFPTR
jgi:hypothetical protein